MITINHWSSGPSSPDQKEKKMSSYFNELQREVREDFGAIKSVEAKAIWIVSLLTGDREFPDDLREEIQGIISLYRYEDISNTLETRGHKQSNITKMSALISELHSAFHKVAESKIKTRFGTLSDNPRRDLQKRESYVNRKYGVQKCDRCGEDLPNGLFVKDCAPSGVPYEGPRVARCPKCEKHNFKREVN